MIQILFAAFLAAGLAQAAEFRYRGLEEIRESPAPTDPAARPRRSSNEPSGTLNECEFGEWQCVSLDVRAKDESVLGVFQFELDSAECRAKEVSFRYELAKGEDSRWRFDAKAAKNAVETECSVTALHKGSHHQKLDRMGAVRMIVSSVRKPKTER